MPHQFRARLERRRAPGTNVGETRTSTSLHEAKRETARLHSACRSPEERLYCGGLCKWIPQTRAALSLILAQCNAIHKTIVDDFRVAIVYGRSVKHQPQRVGLSHELADEDISKYTAWANHHVINVVLAVTIIKK
jgi:hypothetical protein